MTSAFSPVLDRIIVATQLAQRLDKAERAGDEEEVSKLHMRVAASGQNASTSQEEVPV